MSKLIVQEIAPISGVLAVNFTGANPPTYNGLPLGTGGGGTGGGTGGGSGDTYMDPRPLRTTPLILEGLTATGTLKAVSLNWTQEVYRNFSYVKVYRGSSSNWASAVYIGKSQTPFYTDYNVVAGTNYYYWVSSVNFEEIEGPRNATLGTLGNPTLLGNVDLGPGIIEAGNLANGSVSGSTLAAGAIDSYTKFSGALEPIQNVTALPNPVGYLGPRTVSFQGKLYRYTGTAWDASVAASDVTGVLTAVNIPNLDASKISTGTFSAARIADGTLSATKFASSIEPVTIVTAIPGAKLTNVIYSTTTGKQYQWNSTTGAYESKILTSDLVGTITGTNIADGTITTAKFLANSIDGAIITGGTIQGNKIVADSITAGQIQAGAIGADEIAANAVTTSKLTVADFTLLCDNGNFEYGNVGWSLGTGLTITNDVANAETGSWVLIGVLASGSSAARNVYQVPVSTGDQFYLEARIRATGTARGYVRARGLSNAGAEIWTSSGNIITANVWTTSFIISVVPANVVKVNLEVVLEGGTGTVFFDSARMRRASNGQLIVDGSITTEKMLADSINGNRITAGTLSADKLQANSVTAAQIATGAITADELQAGSIVASKLVLTNSDSVLADPGYYDPAWWGWGSDANFITWTGSAPSQPVHRYVQITGPMSGTKDYLSGWSPVEQGGAYRLKLRIYISPDASGWFAPAIHFPGQSWAVPHPYSFRADVDSSTYPVIDLATSVIPRGGWVSYSAPITANIVGSVQIQARTRALLNSGYIEFAWEVVRAGTADLIVDGAITANKLAANSIAVGTAAIQDGAIVNAMIGNLQVTNVKVANDLSAAKITVGEMHGDRISANTFSASKLVAGSITADQIQTGLFSADNALTRNLTVRDAAGNVILAAGTNLNWSKISGQPSSIYNSNITVVNGVMVGIGTSNVSVDNSLLSQPIADAAKTSLWSQVSGRPAEGDILNSYAVIGQNLLANSDMAQAMNWVVGWNPNSANITATAYASTNGAWGTSDYVLHAGSTRNGYVRQQGISSGTVGGSGDMAVGCDVHPGPFTVQNGIVVIPDQRVCFSVYLVTTNCNASIGITYFDGTGAVMSSEAVESARVYADQGGGHANSLSLYSRLHIIDTVPAGAKAAFYYLRKGNTSAGQSESYLFWAAPQFEVINTNAQGPSPYAPGSISSYGQLGYTGDSNATYGANWATNVVGSAAVDLAVQNANTVAQQAKTNADASILALDNIASDNVLTRGEKPVVQQDWDALSGEQAGILAQATSYGMAAGQVVWDEYVNALSSLLTYLNGLSPSWNNYAQDTTINGTTFRNLWATAYVKRQILLNKIAAIAGERAIWSSVSGEGRPTTGLNLIHNGTFESGVNDWMLKHVNNAGAVLLTQSVSDAYSGSNVMELAGNNNACASSRAVAVVPGNSYRIKFRFRAMGGTAVGIWYLGYTSGKPSDGYNGFPDSNSWVPVPGDSYVTVVQGSTWQTYDQVITVPAGMFWVSLGLHRWTGSDLSAKLQIDDVTLTNFTGDLNATYGADWATNVVGASGVNSSISAADTKAQQAKDELLRIADDNWLSKGEKPQTVVNWNTLTGEQTDILAKATAYGVTSGNTTRTNYTTAVSNLGNYLVSLTPSWTDLTSDTPINGPTFRSLWENAYLRRQELLNLLYSIAGERSTWDGVSGRPANDTILNSQIGITGGGMFYNVTTGQSNIPISNNQLTLTSDGKLYTNGTNLLGSSTLNGMGAKAFAFIDQITAANANTYIASAAIDIANIKLASITNLAALSSYLGNVRIDASGSIIGGMSSYGQSSGFALGFFDNTYKFIVGNKSGGGAYIEWDGVNFTEKKDLFTVTLSGNLLSGVNNGTRVYGTLTATVTGGFGTKTISWSWQTGAPDNYSSPVDFYLTGDLSGTTVGVSGTATDNIVSGYITITVTDQNGRIARASRSHAATHGTPP